MQNYSLIARKASKVKVCLLLNGEKGIKVLMNGFFYFKAGKPEIANLNTEYRMSNIEC